MEGDLEEVVVEVGDKLGEEGDRGEGILGLGIVFVVELCRGYFGKIEFLRGKIWVVGGVELREGEVL